MKATYKRLRDGDWGVRVEGAASPGQTVLVEKSDGTAERRTVSRVLWSGKDYKSKAQVSICAIMQKPERRSRFSAGRCSGCGGTLEMWMDGYAVGLCDDCA